MSTWESAIKGSPLLLRSESYQDRFRCHLILEGPFHESGPLDQSGFSRTSVDWVFGKARQRVAGAGRSAAGSDAPWIGAVVISDPRSGPRAARRRTHGQASAC